MELSLYTVKEASNILKCSPAKVYELVRQAEIKPVTRVGKKILIPVISLKSFILGKSVEELLKLKSID